MIYLIVLVLTLYMLCVSCFITNRVIKRSSLSSSLTMMASDPRSNILKGLGGKVIVTGMIL